MDKATYIKEAKRQNASKKPVKDGMLKTKEKIHHLDQKLKQQLQ